MLFNSIAFAAFLPVVVWLYWYVTRNYKAQNYLLLIASWFFYGWWDWRFLLMLIIISVTNFFIGLGMDKTNYPNQRRVLLLAGLILNLGILVVFKYYNFFIDGFIDMISVFGYTLSRSTTKIILPLGISFYVFLSLSYIIDIYKKQSEACKNIVDVLLSLSFFPIILAGPIQRPSTLLPQIAGKREFRYGLFVDGLRQILWGLFTKVVIADNLAFYVDDIFLNYSSYSGSTLFIGVVFYAIQIYADFSGYSNMAIGIGKLLGFNLMKNFAYPYFSRDITEFWKRWHISLTTWFRDYIFLPVSFSVSWKIKSERVLIIKTELFIYIVASSITWVLTGLWHGANYTFLLWGIMHGFLLIIYRWQKTPRKKLFKSLGISNDNFIIVLAESLLTITFVLISWVFFRADNIGHGINYLKGVFSGSFFSLPEFPSRMMSLVIMFLTFLFFILEWFGRKEEHPISGIGKNMPVMTRWALYYTLILFIFFFAGSQQQFIYFQF